MRKFISTLPICVALVIGTTLQSCSNSDSVDDTTGNKPSTSALFAPAKSADVTVYSGSNTSNGLCMYGIPTDCLPDFVGL